MNGLPPLVLRAPQILYGAAIIYLVVSMILTYAEVNASMGYAEAGNPIVRATLLRGFYQGSLEALYLAANGVIVHVLLAIWQRLGRNGGGDS